MNAVQSPIRVMRLVSDESAMPMLVKIICVNRQQTPAYPLLLTHDTHVHPHHPSHCMPLRARVVHVVATRLGQPGTIRLRVHRPFRAPAGMRVRVWAVHRYAKRLAERELELELRGVRRHGLRAKRRRHVRVHDELQRARLANARWAGAQISI
jgi:hypothetical protein